MTVTTSSHDEDAHRTGVAGVVSASARADKLAALNEALANYSAGDNPIIDERREEALAPVRRKVSRLINHRPRSEHELRQRLLEEDFDPELVDIVVEDAVGSGMVDDRTFAWEWVRQRSNNQKKSAAVLRRELQRKGVAAQYIEAALEQVEDDQEAILDELVEKKARDVRRVPVDRQEYAKVLRRIVGVGARRGFPEGQAVRVAREALDRRIAELGE